MRHYELRNPEPPLDGDNGNRTLKVHRQESAAFIVASCARRSLHATCGPSTDHAFLVTIQCSKAQFEEVRAEFNTRRP